MNISTVVFFICYIPELYANYKNKNANIYNIPEKVLMVMGSGFALSYAIVTSDMALITNYGPILTLDVVALLMRAYYVYINRNRDIISAPLTAAPLTAAPLTAAPLTNEQV